MHVAQNLHSILQLWEEDGACNYLKSVTKFSHFWIVLDMILNACNLGSTLNYKIHNPAIKCPPKQCLFKMTKSAWLPQFHHRVKIKFSICPVHGHEIWYFIDCFSCTNPVEDRAKCQMCRTFGSILYRIGAWKTVNEISNFMYVGKMEIFIFHPVDGSLNMDPGGVRFWRAAFACV